MARIRTIKPEFWKDGRIKRLTPACALFFIGLWNFCDDEGKVRADALELSLNLPLFRSQDIVKYLRTLAEAGLTQVSVDREWIVVTNWDHQKIDKPRVPKTLKSEIEWLEVVRETHSPNTLRTFGEESSNIRRKDRIGKDRKGKDRMVATGVAALEPVGPSVVSQTWQAYEEEYERLYRVKPTQNAKVMGQVAQFCKRVPAAEAPSIVRFFLSHPKSFYVQKLHEFGLCLADAESLRTQFLAQTMVTDSMLSEYRKRATETRTRGIAEILADKELNQPQLISRKVANDAE